MEPNNFNNSTTEAQASKTPEASASTTVERQQKENKMATIQLPAEEAKGYVPEESLTASTASIYAHSTTDGHVTDPAEEATAPQKRRIFQHTSKKHAKKAAHRRLRHNANRCGIVCRQFHNYGKVNASGYFHKTIQRDEPGIYIRGRWNNLPASSQLSDFLTEDQLLAWQVWRKRPRKMDRRRMRVNPRVTSRLKASSRPQEPVVQQPANSSKKMSTGQKIAIGVGAALGIGLGWSGRRLVNYVQGCRPSVLVRTALSTN